MKLLAVVLILILIPSAFFSALNPGERVHYSYPGGTGCVCFVSGGWIWYVRVYQGGALADTLLMFAGDLYEETETRPRLARTYGSDYLYVSSSQGKEVLAERIWVPLAVNATRLHANGGSE